MNSVGTFFFRAKTKALSSRVVVGVEKNGSMFRILFRGAMARGSAAKTQLLMFMTTVNVGFSVQKTSPG